MQENTNNISFTPVEILALARHDVQRGALDQALFKTKQLLANANPPDEAVALAAQIYAQLGLIDQAKKLFQQYLENNPKATHANFEYGMAHFQGGETKEALAIWGDVLSEQPTYPPALFYTGLAMMQNGNTTEGQRYLDILLKATPEDNLYVGKAKELLQSLDARPNGAAQIGNTVNQPYMTGH